MQKIQSQPVPQFALSWMEDEDHPESDQEERIITKQTEKNNQKLITVLGILPLILSFLFCIAFGISVIVIFVGVQLVTMPIIGPIWLAVDGGIFFCCCMCAGYICCLSFCVGVFVIPLKIYRWKQN